MSVLAVGWNYVWTYIAHSFIEEARTVESERAGFMLWLLSLSNHVICGELVYFSRHQFPHLHNKGNKH